MDEKLTNLKRPQDADAKDGSLFKAEKKTPESSEAT